MAPPKVPLAKKEKKMSCPNKPKFMFPMFWNANQHDVIYTVFTFIEDNDTCILFAQTCITADQVFRQMILKSSTQLYQLAFLNRENIKDYSIDLFHPYSDNRYPGKFKLNPLLYCTTIKEYEQEDQCVDFEHVKRLYPKLDSIPIDWRVEADKLLIEIIRCMNKKYGNKLMISGGYALKKLTRCKDWVNHQHLVFADKQKTLKVYDEKRGEDIDIFILGENKVQICREILREFYKRINPYLNSIGKCVSIRSCNGLVSLYVENHRHHTGHTYYCQSNSSIGVYSEKYVEFIMKENVETPNDVFSFFDLDCCKIGWFATGKVVAHNDFIRAICTSGNLAPIITLDISKGIKARIWKYYKRTGIPTHIKMPHQLSYFHDKINKGMGKIKKSLIAKKYSSMKIPHNKQMPKSYVYYICECPNGVHQYNVLPMNEESVENIPIYERLIDKYYYEMFGIKRAGLYGNYYFDSVKIDEMCTEGENCW